MTFKDLGLNAPIVKALEEQGYQKPSPIQEGAIPPALAGRDVLGCAQTGTGKTCAFATPILQRLEGRKPALKRPIRALILTPTRELAIQIGESFTAYGKYLKLRHTVIFGGVGQNPQVEALKKGVDILVATPGRLMDLHDQGFVSLDQLEIFVLDEADRMLDMGFIHDVRKILKWLPQKKQTLFFSATMPPEITDLVNSLLRDPARVAVDPISSPVEVIRQSVYLVDKGNKTRLLAHLMEEKGVKNALVFTRTKHGANKVARDLVKSGISAAAIHGNKSQTARQQALAGFKAGKLRCLVATDIAARGLDIEELSHVFNYNLPEVPETYVHRIGRTGRAGRGCEAIAFCDFSEKPLLKDIEKLTGKRIHLVERHPFPMQVFTAPAKNQEDQEARQAAKEAKARQVRPKAPQGKEPGEKAVKLQEAKPVKRGVRPGKKLDTGDAMPRTDFQRPNPLDSDVIMDATARLLAPRRVSLTPAAPAAKKTQSKPNLQSKAPVKAPSKPKARPQAKAAQHRPKPQAQMPRRGRAPEPQRPRAKDSTEQPSLMKPFYINMGD